MANDLPGSSAIALSLTMPLLAVAMLVLVEPAPKLIDLAADLCNLTNSLFAKQTKIYITENISKINQFPKTSDKTCRKKRNGAWFL